MKYTTTLITALYDIKRNSVDTSSSSLKTLKDYYVWFQKTLQINAPMVIYTEEISKPFIIKYRPSEYPTKKSWLLIWKSSLILENWSAARIKSTTSVP